MLQEAARILIAAPASGGGKTTFSCGLMQALVDRGLAVQACKCGPDYIDPMFHREVIGAASHNLDLFFMSEDQVRETVAVGARTADITVIEGVMGYYDGIAVSDEASAWDVARATATPAVLVVDGRGRARSIAAEVLGFCRLRDPSFVSGVVLNRVSAALYPRLKELVEQETGVRVLGHVPVLEDCGLESRHLGLVTAPEVADLRAKLGRIACVLEDTVDIDGILELARSAPALSFDPAVLPDAVPPGGCRSCAGQKGARPTAARRDGRSSPGCLPPPAQAATPPSGQRMTGNLGAPDPVIAVARDDAFCFYYDDTLRMLEALGARLAFFSPLADEGLPQGACGLYLGGGYPELHARELSGNVAMCAAVRAAIRAGMPTVAECGGFMYLHEGLEDEAGAMWPMVGAVRGSSYRTPKLGRFGYVGLTARDDSLLCAAGGLLRAHEFHYWDSEDPGRAFRAEKPQSARGWDCVHAGPSLYAGYPHLCLHAQPEAAARFVRACAAFADRGADGIEAVG